MTILLLMHLAFAIDRQDQVFGQRIDHRHADAVQAAGNLVGVVVELTAGMQHGHDDLGCRAALFRVHIDRDSAAVVGDRHRLVGVDRYRDDRTVAGQGLVDRVVDDLENHVVQTGPVIGVTDVHSGAFPDGLEAL